MPRKIYTKKHTKFYLVVYESGSIYCEKVATKVELEKKIWGDLVFENYPLNSKLRIFEYNSVTRMKKAQESIIAMLQSLKFWNIPKQEEEIFLRHNAFLKNKLKEAF